MRARIETTRLVLRPFESGDAEAAFDWFGDPIVMRFTPTGPDTSIEQTKVRLANYEEHQTEHGFSKWIVLDRGLDRPIGDSGLLALKGYGWIDLGFRLAQLYWGKGLATEAASAWVRAAFDDFHIDRLTGKILDRNLSCGLAQMSSLAGTDRNLSSSAQSMPTGSESRNRIGKIEFCPKFVPKAGRASPLDSESFENQ